MVLFLTVFWTLLRSNPANALRTVHTLSERTDLFVARAFPPELKPLLRSLDRGFSLASEHPSLGAAKLYVFRRN